MLIGSGRPVAAHDGRSVWSRGLTIFTTRENQVVSRLAAIGRRIIDRANLILRRLRRWIQIPACESSFMLVLAARRIWRGRGGI